MDGLRVLPLVGAGRRVADVADRQVAAQRPQVVLLEHLRDEAERALGDDVAADVGGRDPRGLLPTMLQRVEGEVGEPGDVVLRGVDPEDTALVPRSVALVEEWLTCHGAAQRSSGGGRGYAAAGAASPTPTRACRRRSARGLHQFARPSSAMRLGTSSARTTKASTSTATTAPTPISLMNTICEVAKAPMATASSTAAAETSRPVAPMPVLIAHGCETPRSWASLMRPRTNTP